MLPNFLCIGAARAGTTSLYEYMTQHPDIYVPPVKEVHYFTYRHEKWSTNPALSLAGYEEYFAGAEKYILRGEISPSYLWFPGTAQEIRRVLGEIRIIVILRNPVTRAISDFQYSRQFGHNRYGFNELIVKGLDNLKIQKLRLNPFLPSAILWKGFYARQIRAYLAQFRQENIKIFLFDDLVNSPQQFIQELCTLLDIRCALDIPITKTNSRPKKDEVPAEAKAILKKLYRRDILECSQITGRNLNHWLDNSTL